MLLSRKVCLCVKKPKHHHNHPQTTAIKDTSLPVLSYLIQLPTSQATESKVFNKNNNLIQCSYILIQTQECFQHVHRLRFAWVSFDLQSKQFLTFAVIWQQM